MKILLVAEIDVNVPKYALTHNVGAIREQDVRDDVRSDVKKALQAALPYAERLEAVYIPDLLPEPVHK